MVLLTKIEAAISAAIEALGYELVDVEYLTENGRKVLRVCIDKEIVGVNIDDCVKVTREINPILDVEDIIKENYHLEVSSPGIERSLKRDKDFEKAIGEKIKVKTKVPVEGRHNFKVSLKSFDEKEIVVTDSEGRDWVIERSNINKIKQQVEF